MTDVLIIGAGPAGLSAAIYAARAGMKVIVFDKNAYGGQISLTSEVDNYPGLPGIDGVDFAMDLYTHAVSQGAEVRFETVEALELDGNIKRLTTKERVYEGRTVILACGAKRRKLGCPGEDIFTGKGVSYCATCDAAFFRDQEVVIVGGGDTALTDALFLSNNCKKVYLVVRRDVFRGTKIKQDLVRARKNVEIIFGSSVKTIAGVERVQMCLLDTPQGERELAISGVFVAIGLEPETHLFKGMIPLTLEGYVEADEHCYPGITGVWVAGDLRHKPLRQIITAAADGAVSGVAAAEYCNALDENIAGLFTELLIDI